MKKVLSFIAVLFFLSNTLYAQFLVEGNKPVFYVDGKLVVETPKEGLWSIARMAYRLRRTGASPQAFVTLIWFILWQLY